MRRFWNSWEALMSKGRSEWESGCVLARIDKRNPQSRLVETSHVADNVSSCVSHTKDDVAKSSGSGTETGLLSFLQRILYPGRTDARLRFLECWNVVGAGMRALQYVFYAKPWGLIVINHSPGWSQWLLGFRYPMNTMSDTSCKKLLSNDISSPSLQF